MTNTFLKATRLFAIFLIVLAAIFLLLAASNATSVTPLVLSALALTWVVWAALLLWVTGRFEAYRREKGDSFDFELKLDLRRKKNKAAQSDAD